MAHPESRQGGSRGEPYATLIDNGEFLQAARQIEDLISAKDDEEEEDNLAKLHLTCAKCYWNLGGDYVNDKRLCFAHILQAAQLDAESDEPFTLLGRYYSQVANDVPRARKCYQRALAINDDASEAGQWLCNDLHRQGQFALEESICSNAAENSPTATWAWRRLGFCHVRKGDNSSAISSFYGALRVSPDDSTTWEALGACYQRMGMLTSAKKAYEKAVSLSPSREYALLQLARVEYTMGNNIVADDLYTRALRLVSGDNPRSATRTAALYGLAQVRLALAHRLMKDGARPAAGDLLASAEEVVLRAIDSIRESGAASGSVWKLLGDVLLAQSATVNCSGDVDDGYAWQDRWPASLEFSRRARRAYCKELHLFPCRPASWFDVASSLSQTVYLNCRVTMGPNSEDQGIEVDVKQIRRFLRSSLSQESSNSERWHSFAKACHRQEQKQHCLVRALQLDPRNAEAWATLGEFYLDEGDLVLAGKSFEQTRSLNPAIASAWEGLALMKEEQRRRGVVGDFQTNQELQEEEILGCLLHAVRLGPTLRAAVMLSHYVLARIECDGIEEQAKGSSGALNLSSCLSLKAERSLHEAYLGLMKACEAHPYNLGSAILLGCVCEARTLYLDAIRAYRRVRAVLATTEHAAGQQGRVELAQICLGNLARCLCRVGQHNEAVTVFAEMDSLKMLDKDALGLQCYAAALSSVGSKQAAAEVAYRAIAVAEVQCGSRTESCETLRDREARNVWGSVLSGRAAILSQASSEEHLHQLLSEEVARISIESVQLALLVVSLAATIRSLSHAAVQSFVHHVQQTPGGSAGATEVALLCGCYCAMIGHDDQSLRYLMKDLHRAPMTANRLRRALCAYLSRLYPAEAKLGLIMDSNETNLMCSTNSELLALAPMPETAHAIREPDPVSWAQRMVHLNPANAASWRHLERVRDTRSIAAASQPG